MRYGLYLEWKTAAGYYMHLDTLRSTRIVHLMSIEICLALVAPVPILKGTKHEEWYKDYNTSAVYEVNDILLVFAFLIRTFWLSRVALVNTMYMSPRADRIS